MIELICTGSVSQGTRIISIVRLLILRCPVKPPLIQVPKAFLLMQEELHKFTTQEVDERSRFLADERFRNMFNNIRGDYSDSSKHMDDGKALQ